MMGLHNKATAKWVFATSPNTTTDEGLKGMKLARFDLLPPDALKALAEHYGRSAQKYDDRNWEKGYKWSLSYAALLRHLTSFWEGDDVDHDPTIGNSLHIVAVAWHALCLLTFALRNIGTDDRPKTHKEKQ